MPGFLWFYFPLIGWGNGFAMHLLFGMLWSEEHFPKTVFLAQFLSFAPGAAHQELILFLALERS